MNAGRRLRSRPKRERGPDRNGPPEVPAPVLAPPLLELLELAHAATPPTAPTAPNTLIMHLRKIYSRLASLDMPAAHDEPDHGLFRSQNRATAMLQIVEANVAAAVSSVAAAIRCRT